MSVYQKLQTSVGLNIVSSDNADIPSVAVVDFGTATTISANQLVDSAATFQNANVQVGDVVYNNVTLQAATVTRVVNQTTIELNANIFLVLGEAYTLYAQNEKNAAVLFIGTGGKLRVLTAGGQDVIFDSILGGTFLPVQVLKVFQTGTTATNLVALW